MWLYYEKISLFFAKKGGFFLNIAHVDKYVYFPMNFPFAYECQRINGYMCVGN